MSIHETEIMTQAECAKYLKVSSRTFYTLIEDGEIPWFSVGKSKRFRKSRVDEALDTKERKGNYLY
jgi:excisionase family DNA binding protein